MQEENDIPEKRADRMTSKLQPTIGEIPEINPEERRMKLRCTGKGEALWAHFDLLYPIIITSRKFLGRLHGGASQDVEIMAVKIGGEMRTALPSHIGPGAIDIIVQAKGSVGIEIELNCRVEPQTEGESAESESVADAVAALTESVTRPEDPAARPGPVDPRKLLPAPPMQVVEGPFPPGLPPAVAAQATENLNEMLNAGDMDESTRASITAFMEAGGDPTDTLAAATPQKPDTEPT